MAPRFATRERSWLLRRYRAIGVHLGLVAALLGGVLLTPLLLIPFRPEEGVHSGPFLAAGLGLAAGGIALWRVLRTGRDGLSLREGAVAVLLGWLLACVVAAWPLMAVEGLTFTQALFESVSGWTTTGLSVLDVAQARGVTLLLRSVMQLAGGAGFAILMVGATLGTGDMALPVAEGRPDLLVPNVRASARLVLRIYLAYAGLGVLALRIAGMSMFDAVNHPFCAVSTGGFSTRADSIGAWHSPAVEGVTMVLMVLGSLNFVTAWMLIRGRIRPFLANGEIRLMLLMAPAAALLLGFAVLSQGGGRVEAVRIAVFQAVSALTTTGYSTVALDGWSPLGILVLVILMLVGGAACSTAGGLKQSRVFLLWRVLQRELVRPLRPATEVRDDRIWEGPRRVAIGEARIRSVAAYGLIYLASWLGGACVLAAHGHDVRDSLFEFASALGTVGLSVGLTGPSTPPGILWVEMAGMLLGRLEFVVVFVGLAKLARDAGCVARGHR